MLRRMDESGVAVTIVQRHDEIANLCARYPGRFFGLASVSPHIGEGKYEPEIEKGLFGSIAIVWVYSLS